VDDVKEVRSWGWKFEQNLIDAPTAIAIRSRDTQNGKPLAVLMNSKMTFELRRQACWAQIHTA